jgi:hypothetical protein
MSKQTVPHIQFDCFVLKDIKGLLDVGKIYINKEYQRGDIWKDKQKVELIRSIVNCYSIGVLVLYLNDEGNFEILDGQQRLLTIQKYLNDELDLTGTKIQKYSELDSRDRTLLDAYCIYYLKLESHDPRSKEEDIVQTFLRLQEGTPLNKAEKLNAQRGRFKDTFRHIRETHPLFTYLGKEKRFRFRQLAAEMFLLEVDGDFGKKTFPSLDLESMLQAIKKHENNISQRKVRFFRGNLDFLHQSLNIILTAFKSREVISFYLLISYLRKNKADNRNLKNEFAEFAVEFLKNLNSFSMYDQEPPKDMEKDVFIKYKSYKEESKILTTPDSISKRLDIMLSEFNRLHPFIQKDEKRLHDNEQKRILYFRQKGLCAECGKVMSFHGSSGHHGIAHCEGAKTNDLSHAKLMHEKYHEKLERRKAKERQAKLI